MASFDEEKLKAMILKLLDKAGRDPRLTPKILRNKAEERLKLETGTLKPKRAFIKELIFQWWDVNMKGEQKPEKGNGNMSKDDLILTKLNKLAKVSGHLQLLRGLADLELSDKISKLRSRLRESGIKLSDVPTDEEIDKARRDYERKQDVAGLDSSAILISGAKRGREIKVEKNEKRDSKQKLQYNSSDEEVDL